MSDYLPRDDEDYAAHPSELKGFALIMMVILAIIVANGYAAVIALWLRS